MTLLTRCSFIVQRTGAIPKLVLSLTSNADVDGVIVGNEKNTNSRRLMSMYILQVPG